MREPVGSTHTIAMMPRLRAGPNPDGEARQTGRNYVFFGAPVGLIFTTHAALTRHSWLDCGLFLQSVMLAAQVRGLATCPQVSFVRFQSVIAEQLGLAPDELVTCGMSCGYEDKQAAVPLKAVSKSLGLLASRIGIASPRAPPTTERSTLSVRS